MKVLHVVSSIGRDYGGPPRVVFELCNALKSNHEQTILSTYRPGEQLLDLPTDLDVVTFPRNNYEKLWVCYAPGIKNYVAAHIHNFDLIHLHELWCYPQFWPGKWAMKAGIPIVVTGHGHFDPEGVKQSGYKKVIYRKGYLDGMLKKATAVIVLNKREQEHAAEFLPQLAPKSVVIPNGLSEDSLHSFSVPTISEGKPYLLFLSRIHRQKGLDLFLEAYAQWPDHTSWPLVVAGPFDSPAYEKQMLAMVAERNLHSSVSFIGPVEGGKKVALLKNASALVLTSRFEGLPTILLESMLAGTPMILSDNCGIDSFLGVRGLALVSQTQPDSICQSLARFSENHTALKARATQIGPVLVNEYFTANRTASRVHRLYQLAKQGSFSNQMIEELPF